MSSIIGSTIGTVLATKLPFDNGTNIALGMAGGQLVSLSLDKFTTFGGWLWSIIGFNSNMIRINANEGGRFNPIYKKMEEYILEQYAQQLTQCNLEPVKGEVSIGLREAIFMKPIKVSYEYQDKPHTLYLTLSAKETTVSVNNNSSSKKNDDSSGFKSAKTIEITSRTANVGILKTFVTDIVKLEKKQSQSLTVYRASGLKKDETPHWDCLRFKSNKTIENTILKKETDEELFKDVNWFIENEEWYTDKGIDYKRGYLLHGPPGTGKTSSIKAIANKYNLPIFTIDLESIKTNNQLITLANDILYESPDKPYILAIEDFDRHDMFLDKWSYNHRQKKVTLQCLLNVIDGVVESHGRILIITCNEKKEIESIEALVRPGRIDRVVEIGYLNGDQTSRLINNYFNLNISISDDNIEENVTPAQLIKKMQTSQSFDATIHYICKDKEKVKEQIDPDTAVISLSDVEKPDDLEKPGTIKKDKNNSSKSKHRFRRRGRNPGKNVAEKKAWVIKQKQRKIANLEKTNTNRELTKRKLEIEIEYAKNEYIKLKTAQDQRDKIKKEKELLKKKRERAKKKRELEKVQGNNKKRKIVHAKKSHNDEDDDEDDDNDDNDDNEEDGSVGNITTVPYTTRSGRATKSVTSHK